MFSTSQSFAWASKSDAEFQRDTALVTVCSDVVNVLKKYFTSPESRFEVCPFKQGATWDVAFVVIHPARATSADSICSLFERNGIGKKVRDMTTLPTGEVCISLDMPVSGGKNAAQLYAEKKERASSRRRSSSGERHRASSRRRTSERRSPSPSRHSPSSSRRSPSPVRRSLHRGKRSSSPDERDRSLSPARRTHKAGLLAKGVNFLLGN